MPYEDKPDAGSTEDMPVTEDVPATPDVPAADDLPWELTEEDVLEDNFLKEKPQQKVKLTIRSDVNVNADGNMQPAEAKSTSRTIPPALKQKLLSETAGKCAYPNCNHPAEIFHHTDRFAISHSHESLKPLCKIHHEFMHNGLVKNEQEPSANWQFDLAARHSGPTAKIDELYGKKRLGR